MIEDVLNYVRSFFVLFLLMKVLLFFIPKSEFSKYISFFSGVILVIGILHPMLQLLDMDEAWLRSVYDNTFEKQALEASLNATKSEAGNNAIYHQQMKALVESEIQKQMQAEGMCVEAVEVELTEDYQVNRISVVAAEEKEEGDALLRAYLQTEYRLSAEQCEIRYE